MKRWIIHLPTITMILLSSLVVDIMSLEGIRHIHFDQFIRLLIASEQILFGFRLSLSSTSEKGHCIPTGLALYCGTWCWITQLPIIPKGIILASMSGLLYYSHAHISPSYPWVIVIRIFFILKTYFVSSILSCISRILLLLLSIWCELSRMRPYFVFQVTS